jgi:hypothetical protein
MTELNAGKEKITIFALHNFRLGEKIWVLSLCECQSNINVQNKACLFIKSPPWPFLIA